MDNFTILRSLSQVLPHIFDNLPLQDLKNVSLVSRLWSQIAFSGRFMNRVLLKLDFRDGAPDLHRQYLLESSRAYRHIGFYYRSDQLDLGMLLEVLEKFEQSIVSLKICPNYFIMLAELRQILVQVSLKLCIFAYPCFLSFKLSTSCNYVVSCTGTLKS